MSAAGPMQVRSVACFVPAPRAAVFRYLADVEALPGWAGEFCESLELCAGGWRGLTAEGELFIELEADERSGVIDLRLGDHWSCWRSIALRVVAWPGGQTVVSAVFVQEPSQTAFAFERQCDLLGRALSGVDAWVREDLRRRQRLAS